MRNIRLLVAFVSALIPLGMILAASPSWTSFPQGLSHEVVFAIPVGEGGVHYEGVGVPDALTWGPATFTVGADGTFWIADTVVGAVLHYTPKGELIAKLSLGGQASGIADIEVTTTEVLLLDQSLMPPKLVRLAMDGSFEESLAIPKGLHAEDGLSGIVLGDQGDVLIEREGGARLSLFLNQKGEVVVPPLSLAGYALHGRLYAASPADLTSADPHLGWISAGDTKIEIDVPNSLGGLRILGANPAGDFFVIVEELAVLNGLMVDQTVRHYSPNGELLGMARIPLDEQYPLCL